MYSRSYKYYVAGVLMVVYIFNQTDRAIFALVMEPIKKAFGLSDTALGFLAGPAFAIFYAALGIPIARLADRSNRINIMSVAVAAWSLVVVASASVTQFWQFVLTRIGVGVGEAGFSAIGMSVLADYHPPAERSRALSIFLLSIPIAGVASSLIGGWINQLYGWRMVFIVAGLPGIFLALLMKATVREPAREIVAGVVEGVHQSTVAVFAHLWRRRSLWHLFIAQALANAGYGALGWIPAFFMRDHHMNSGELGTWLAVISGVGGCAGVWLSGYLSDRLGGRDPRVVVRLMAAMSAVIMPIYLVILWCPSKQLALLLLIPAQVPSLFFLAPTMSVVQGLTPPNSRATMASIFIFLQLLAGGVVGFEVVGVLSDALLKSHFVATSAGGLRWAMTLTSFLSVWAGLHFWTSGRTIRTDMAARDPVPAAA